MATAKPASLDLKNIQGDILEGLPKFTETYLFFQIDPRHVAEFRQHLHKVLPLITSTAQVLKSKEDIKQHKQKGEGKIKAVGVNLLFSQHGLDVLGIKEPIGDSVFQNGMLKDAQNLGDPGTVGSDGKFVPDWDNAFKKEIHGMFDIAGDSHATVEEKIREIKHIFRTGHDHHTATEVLSLTGDVRPGKERGHEHFGFLDGISQPAVSGYDTKPNPGQETVHQGIVLLGREGDPVTRPSWAVDGSFLAFRFLPQLVPEFDTFLKENPIPGLPRDEGSELLGARLVGRWKSGAPIDVFPIKDDPKAGRDPSKNNNFRYTFAPEDPATQTRCPFAAHVRKTNPRADLEDLSPPIPTENRRIIRRGIQFGPEMTKEEIESGKTKKQRGLLFAAYQSDLAKGFQFIQTSWANNPGFIFGKSELPGFDPLIGQVNTAGAIRTMSGSDPKNANKSLTLPTNWVQSRGGEYFFSPSLKALKETFAHAPKESGHKGSSDEL